MGIRTMLLIILLGLTTTLSARAETFTWSFQGDIQGMDPYALNETFTIGFLGNIYEGLVRRDRDLNLEPSLATEWSNPEPNIWRFKLREGVKFHDGEDFTADDVVFSFERVTKPGSDLASLLTAVKEVRQIDDHTIEFVTHAPDPILPQTLSLWYIMPRDWAEEHGAVDPQDIKAGKENYATRNANGTGPFKVERRDPDVQTVLVPNPDWWDEARHNLTRVVFRPIGAAPTRVAALLSGEIDMMYPVPLQDISRIENTPGRQVLQGPELRTIFIGMDQWRDAPLGSNLEGKNPFKDARVRKAIYQAIDIEAIHKKIMRGASNPTALLLGPGINGFDPTLNERYPYDPEASKQLLSEAGFPDGFAVTMDCPNDRYVNDEAICQAVVSMLARIGVKVNLQTMPKSQYFAKISAPKYDTSFYLHGWTPATYDSHNVLFNLMATRADLAEGEVPSGQGQFNNGGYSNPKVDELTHQIGVELDPEQRQAMISEAFKIHKEEVGALPLHQQTLAWGVKDNIDLVQRADDILNLYWVNVR